MGKSRGISEILGINLLIRFLKFCVFKKRGIIRDKKNSKYPDTTTQRPIVDSLCVYEFEYVKVSSGETHSITLQRRKIDEEIRINRLFEENMGLDNGQPYNTFFTTKELKIALNSKKNLASGANTIHYEMLKQLPERNKFILLKLINKSWETGELPTTWKESTITPLLKPNKYPQEPTSYQPISLTSAICKTMETMVNNRLLKK